MSKIYIGRVLAFLIVFSAMLLARQEKPLCNETEEDALIEQVYRKGLSDYLVEVLDLKDYDDLLANSEERIIPNSKEDMSEAQKRDMCGLQYIYMRNDIHVERLSEEQRALLETQVVDQKVQETLSDEVMEMIKETFPAVIAYKEITSEEDRSIETYYDSRLQQDFVTIDALVLKIGTSGEFDEDGNYVDRDHEFEKEEFLMAFAEEMESNLSDMLESVPIRVLLH